MAECRCGLEMMEADGCNFTSIVVEGKRIKRVTENFGEPDGRCHDCNAKHGEVHHLQCDAESCPICGEQLIGCGCLSKGKVYFTNQ